MATGTKQPTRKPSIRQKFRESFRTSYIKTYLDIPERESSKRLSVDVPEGSWIGKRRKKGKQTQPAETKHDLNDLSIETGGLGDLRLSFEDVAGDGLRSPRSPRIPRKPVNIAIDETAGLHSALASPGKQQTVVLMKKLDQRSPLTERAPRANVPPTELEDTSNVLPKATDSTTIPRIPQEAVVEPKKARKWEVKETSLVRPVSSGKGNDSSNISKTLESINNNAFGASGKICSPVDNISRRPSIDSNRTAVPAKVDSVLGSNSSTSTVGTRKLVVDTSKAADRHSVGSMNTLVTPRTAVPHDSSKRQSFPTVAMRNESLLSTQHSQPPKSPAGSTFSIMSAVPRPRAPSGSGVSQRLAWLREMEANGGKKTPGQEYMQSKLQGGVADKLKRFETQTSSAAPGGIVRAHSVSSRRPSVTPSDAYGIESGVKRLSNQAATDNSFKRSLEEKIQKKKQEEEEERSKRSSVASSNPKTPQAIIDFAESVDADREVVINSLTSGGKADENARALDVQAHSTLAALDGANRRQGRLWDKYPATTYAATRDGSARPLSATSKASDAKSSAALVDSNIHKPGAPRSMQRFLSASDANTKPATQQSVQRTQSVRTPRSPAVVARSPRPTSFAAVSVPVDDDYDPFNYAVYPSPSNFYSNPDDEPYVEPAAEEGEDEFEALLNGGPKKYLSPEEYEAATAEAKKADIPIIQAPVEEAAVEAKSDEALKEPAQPLESKEPEQPREPEHPKQEQTVAQEKPTDSAASMPKLLVPGGESHGAATPTPVNSPIAGPGAATSWGSRFQPKGGDGTIAGVLAGAGVGAGVAAAATVAASGKAGKEKEGEKKVEKTEEKTAKKTEKPTVGSTEENTAEATEQPAKTEIEDAKEKTELDDEEKAEARPEARAQETEVKTEEDTQSLNLPEIRGGPGKIEAVLASAGVEAEKALPSEEKVEEVAEKSGESEEKNEEKSEEKIEEKTTKESAEPKTEPATLPHTIGGPGKIEAVLASAGVDLEKPLPSDSEAKETPNEHDELPTLPHTIGGPGKIEAVLASAGVDLEKPLPSASEAKEPLTQDSKSSTLPHTIGGPGKIEAVLASAGVDLAAPLPPAQEKEAAEAAEAEEEVFRPRGGPEKIANVLGAAGVDSDATLSSKDSGKEEKQEEAFRPRGGPEKIANVLGAAGVDLDAPLPSEDGGKEEKKEGKKM